MNLDSERQAFESAWDKRQRADWARGGRDPDQYPIGWGLAFKLTGWEMWQARAALSQQEPIAWVRMLDGEIDWGEDCLYSAKSDHSDDYSEDPSCSVVPLFAAPPAPLAPVELTFVEWSNSRKLSDASFQVAFDAWNAAMKSHIAPTKIANLEDDEIMEVARKVYGTKATFQEIDFARYIIAQSRGQS